MSRVIVLNVRAHGHINPTLPVIRELGSRGEEVIYYTWEEFRAKVEATGAAFRPSPDMPEFDTDRLTGNPLELGAFLVETTRIVLPAMLDEIKALQPDYLIHDALCPWGKLIAQVLKRPAIASVTSLPLNETGGRSLRDLAQVVRMSLTGTAYIRRFQSAAQALSARYAVEPPTLTDIFSNHEPLNLVYTSRAFVPHADSFDDSYCFVGPSIAPRGDTGDFPLEMLDGRQAIYVSLGTVLNARPDFYRLCFTAFEDFEGPIVLSVGRHTDRSALGTLPANVIVREIVPQLEVLQRVALFVTQGGMNSVQEALYHDVPLVIVPQTQEQRGIADRVAQLQAGVVLDAKRLSAH